MERREQRAKRAKISERAESQDEMRESRQVKSDDPSQDKIIQDDTRRLWKAINQSKYRRPTTKISTF